MRLIYNYFILLFLLFSNLVFGQDSVVMKAYTVGEFNKLVETTVDTNLNTFEIYDFSFQNSFSNTYLSNTGLASKSNLYYLIENTGFLFNNSMYPYFISSKNIKYYNTKKHFTNLSFYSNMSKKNNNQVLRVIHTQNITKKFNVGLVYDMISSKGEFQKQMSSNNGVTLFTYYKSDKYSLNGNFIYNKLKYENNGGIDEKYVTKDLFDANITVIPVRLYNSKSVNMNREINLFHELKLDIETVNDSLDSIKYTDDNYYKVSHKLKYQYNRLNYYDSDTLRTFYSLVNIDSLNTRDSTYQNILDNSVYFDFIKNNGNKTRTIGVSYLNIFENFYYYNKNINFLNNGVGVNFDIIDSLNYSFITGVNYFVDGRKTNDLLIYANYRTSIIKNKFDLFANINYKNIRPDYFEEHFNSNNAGWDTTFAKNKSLTNIKLSISNNKYDLKIGMLYGIYDNMIYFKDSLPFDGKTLISPHQETSTFNYFSFWVSKNFNFKHFRFLNKLAYQKSGNAKVLSVPEFSFFNSSSFNFVLVKNVLKAEIGFDVYYYTKFHADNFMPSTSLFYRQTETKIGDYPKVDAFLKLKLKRARLFFKFEHANYGMTGSNFYAGIDQPLAPRVFRFGVSWSFYD